MLVSHIISMGQAEKVKKGKIIPIPKGTPVPEGASVIAECGPLIPTEDGSIVTGVRIPDPEDIKPVAQCIGDLVGSTEVTIEKVDKPPANVINKISASKTVIFDSGNWGMCNWIPEADRKKATKKTIN